MGERTKKSDIRKCRPFFAYCSNILPEPVKSHLAFTP